MNHKPSKGQCLPGAGLAFDIIYHTSNPSIGDNRFSHKQLLEPPCGANLLRFAIRPFLELLRITKPDPGHAHSKRALSGLEFSDVFFIESCSSLVGSRSKNNPSIWKSSSSSIESLELSTFETRLQFAVWPLLAKFSPFGSWLDPEWFSIISHLLEHVHSTDQPHRVCKVDLESKLKINTMRTIMIFYEHKSLFRFLISGSAISAEVPTKVSLKPELVRLHTNAGTPAPQKNQGVCHSTMKASLPSRSGVVMWFCLALESKRE
ncbi:hypothetical protein RF11_08236 [Thelohanellus kitauei]|uniref:Uncharacterized protein n=1 Tax=Thelohanellus kitauei TaxID=669202 RepID=A0A0C2I8Z7_THEKT|nr:hypothetical protein RF11_02131 [Thelohanellus kitauei]KII61683.1 hypothetical protein RF11_08236 [Thelohanellus kitauei]